MRQLLMFSILLFASTALAQNYWVEPVSGTHVSDSDRDTVTELLKIALQSKGAKIAPAEGEGQFRIRSKVLKLGDAYILSSSKLGADGKVRHSTQMKAMDLSDMDTVTSRVADSLISEVAVAETADVTNITADEEIRNTRRYQATRQWLIGLGPGWSSGLGSEGGGSTFSLGYLWGLDPDFALSLTYTVNNGPEDDDSSFSDFSFGIEHFFSRTKNSAVIGARLGHGTVTKNGCGAWLNDCEDGSESGWNAAVFAGYKFFRTSSVNVGLMGTYFISMSRFESENPGMGTVQVVVYY